MARVEIQIQNLIAMTMRQGNSAVLIVEITDDEAQDLKWKHLDTSHRDAGLKFDFEPAAAPRDYRSIGTKPEGDRFCNVSISWQALEHQAYLGYISKLHSIGASGKPQMEAKEFAEKLRSSRPNVKRFLEDFCGEAVYGIREIDIANYNKVAFE